MLSELFFLLGHHGRAAARGVYRPSARAFAVAGAVVALAGCSSFGDVATIPDESAGDGGAVVSQRGNAGPSDSGPRPDGGGGKEAGACVTLAPDSHPKLVHVDGTAAQAQAVKLAIEAILADDAPPIPPLVAYVIPSLSCQNLASVNPAQNGFACYFTVDDGAAPKLTLATQPGSLHAQNLYDALGAAGATPCVEPHGDFTRLEHLTVDAHAIHFDDVSTYALPPAPNLTVDGAAASAVVSAVAAAGLSDCDPTRSLFLVCNGQSSMLACSASFLSRAVVSGSSLAPACGPTSTTPGTSLSATQSMALWDAILAAAKAKGFTPMNGTLEQATVINAGAFRWDGSTLAFDLTVDDAQPPPPPGP